MPRPVYIIPAKLVTVDQRTNLVTIGAITEMHIVRAVRRDGDASDDLEAARDSGKVAGTIEAQETQVVAVWMKEEGDEEKAFEHRLSLRRQGSDESTEIGIQPFQFPPEKRMSRFIGILKGMLPPGESCVVELESCVREIGTEEWIVQSYPLVFDVTITNEADCVEDQRSALT
jgi:hypothetical protein